MRLTSWCCTAAERLAVLRERSPAIRVNGAGDVAGKLQGLVDVVKLVPCPVRDQGRQAASAFSLGLCGRTDRRPHGSVRYYSGGTSGSMP